MKDKIATTGNKPSADKITTTGNKPSASSRNRNYFLTGQWWLHITFAIIYHQ